MARMRIGSGEEGGLRSERGSEGEGFEKVVEYVTVFCRLVEGGMRGGEEGGVHRFWER